MVEKGHPFQNNVQLHISNLGNKTYLIGSTALNYIIGLFICILSVYTTNEQTLRNEVHVMKDVQKGLFVGDSTLNTCRTSVWFK